MHQLLAPACCGLLSFVYVVSLYVWRVPPARQHPTTVRWRMLGVTLTSCVAWLPAWLMHKQWQATDAGQGRPVPPLLALLGLHLRGAALLAALARSLLLVATMFAGPLLHNACCWWQSRCRDRPQGTFAGAAAGLQARRDANSSSSWLRPQRGGVCLTIHQLRDYVVAPAAEEWSFRACMVPLLWMQGYSPATTILVTPLFFASCHLHHARELARAHGLGPALCTVGLQFAYTTLAGWGFTFVLMASGSVLAAALAHGCCNVMGLPPFHRMGTVARAASVAGVVAAVGWVAPWLAHQSSGSAYAWT